MASEIINGLFPGELHPTNVLAGCIYLYENVWPDPQGTIKTLESLAQDYNSGVYWQRASTLDAGDLQNHRTNQMLGITHLAKVAENSALQNIHNQLNLLLIAASVPYAKQLNIGRGLWHEDYSALKYSVGEEYLGHYDGSTDTGRAISALIYLNDDYEGGETEFPHFGIKLKPKPGMLALFPSNYAYFHIAHKINSGTKYALVTWIKDREF